MNKEMLADLYAKRTGRTLEKMLGLGRFGEAYLLNDGRVVKVTSDACEALASAHVHKGDAPAEQASSVVSVYHIEAVSDLFIIEQERVLHNLDNNGRCDEIYWQLENAAAREGYELDEMFDAMSLSMIIMQVASPDASSVVASIKNARALFHEKGLPGEAVDLASDNFGFREDGSVALFDLRLSSFSQEQANEQLKSLFPDIFKRTPTLECGSDLTPC